MSLSPAAVWAKFSPSRGSQIVVTGDSGAGKTTWCAELAAYVRGLGLQVAGLSSPGVFVDGQKTGISLVDLASGERRQLATRRLIRDEASPTPNWQFNAETLAWGEAVLKRIASCDLLVIDELGPLELLHGQGWHYALPLLEQRCYTLACVVVRPGLLARFQQLFPLAQVIDLQAV